MSLLNNMSVGQINTVSLDIKGNKERILEACTKAVDNACGILLLPELTLSGVNCAHLFQVKSFVKQCEEELINLTKELPAGLVVALGLPLIAKSGRIYNAYAAIRRNEVLGVTFKYIYNYHDPLDDSFRYFAAGQNEEEFVIGSKVFSVSSRVINCRGFSLGVAFDDWPVGLQDCDIVIIPNAQPYELDSLKKRQEQLINLSKEVKGVVAATNILGCEGGTLIYDGQGLIAKDGKIIASSRPFNFKRSNILCKECGIYAGDTEYDEIIRAISLGLFDWMVKTRSKGFALSLSGGADSALCASAVAVGQACALEDLGAGAYLKLMASLGINLPMVGDDHEAYIKNTVLPLVLTTVYQASKNSGKVTRNAASKLASCLGATHYELEIAKAVDVYVKLFDKLHRGNTLSWDKDDLTLQNIQARSRLPSIWMFANRENKLLISTGNLSEAVVGYCTMDGDTAGGVDPIGGIGKSRILKINRHIAEDGVKLFANGYTFSIPDMSYVVNQEPTAELRPGGEQKDEKDLMPYVLLDAIRSLFNVNKLSPLEIFNTLSKDERFSNIAENELEEHIKRYFRLNARSQWKRKRFAATFHIEKDSCDVWSLPILNDSMENMINEL